MRLGYNTNGLAHHDAFEAIELLAQLGYRSVALTLDHHALNPFAPDLATTLARMRSTLRRLGLRSVIETGARFLLEPSVKHEPTLISPAEPARAHRIEFLRRAILIAAYLESDCVSLWSGVLRESIERPAALDRLVQSLQSVVAAAELAGVTVGFEPEPGMLIDTMERFDELSALVGSPRFQLTLDVGHLHCQGETPVEDYVERYAKRIVNIHLEDMRRGVHEHLEFGQGEMSFPPLFAALRRIDYRGGVHVELSRQSADGPAAARRAYEFLAPLLPFPD